MEWLSLDLEYGDPKLKNYWELIYPILIAVVLIFLRLILNNYVFKPFAIYRGLHTGKQKKAPHIPQLEKIYNTSKNWMTDDKVKILSKKLDLPVEEIRKWYKLKIAENKPTILVKFCESCWRLSYYTVICIVAIFILWDKPWLWDINQSWHDLHNQTVPNDIYWYFMTTLGFVWTLLFGLAFETKRKDFHAMLIHHIAVIIIMILVWKTNVYRIYSVGIIVFDVCDILIEGFKIAKYLDCQKTATLIFVTFVVVWMLTRLGLFPFWILKSVLFESCKELPLHDYLISYVFLCLLAIFCILNCVWTYFILKMALRFAVEGYVGDDSRSDSEED